MWLSYFTKSLSLVLVLPLILTRFPVEDISLWYLFLAIISLQQLADLGFTPTFSRVIAYATSGATRKELASFKSVRSDSQVMSTNWDTIGAICGSMRVVYIRLTVLSVGLLVTGGTAFLYAPIEASSAPPSSWWAWGTILGGSCFILGGNQFSAYLQGLNRIALLRRWEAVTNLGAVGTSYVVMLVAPSVFWLVVADQTWKVLNVVRNYLLCRLIDGGRFKGFRIGRGAVDPVVLDAVWPSAWRTGVGALMAQAPLQFSGLFYAQIGRAEMVASYLFGLNLLGYVRTFSLAPFYTKLPMMAKLRAAGEIERQLHLARRGMRVSLGVFCLGFFALGFLGNVITEMLGSNAAFPFPLLWNLMGIGMLIERFGAMHLQLYSTTNHVIAHYANGITGVVFVVLAGLLIAPLDVLAFPVAYTASYLTFYAPYTASKSYRLFSLDFFTMERTSAIPVVLVTVAYLVVSWFLSVGPN